MASLALLLGFKKGRFFRKNLPFLELDKGKDWRVILRMPSGYTLGSFNHRNGIQEHLRQIASSQEFWDRY